MIDWSTAWKGTKLIDRIEWARSNLKRRDTEYCIVYEDIDMDAVFVMHPDPHCMAMLMHGHLMPPAWAKMKAREAGQGYLLHETEPMGPLTEEEAVEWLIQTTVPKHIWENWNSGNKPKMVICTKKQLPATREWRDAWTISEELGVAA